MIWRLAAALAVVAVSAGFVLMVEGVKGLQPFLNLRALGFFIAAAPLFALLRGAPAGRLGAFLGWGAVRPGPEEARAIAGAIRAGLYTSLVLLVTLDVVIFLTSITDPDQIPRQMAQPVAEAWLAMVLAEVVAPLLAARAACPPGRERAP